MLFAVRRPGVPRADRPHRNPAARVEYRLPGRTSRQRIPEMYPIRFASAVRRARNAVAGSACVLASGAVAAPAPSHPFRLSVADVGVTGSVLQARIRFFWDDLQLAVMERTSDAEFELAENETVDEVVEAYINDMLVIEVDTVALQGEVTARGVEDAARIDEVMWWYRLEYALPRSTERIRIRNRLLFNMFEDQRNIVNLKTRTGRERTYHFSRDQDDVALPIG